ncbi:MAG TPA: AAA family ATPase [Candidatus Limnocylindrales bacterium]|nr:AAA family ATPase [Candidatus Limnocylindrales bacterium]
MDITRVIIRNFRCIKEAEIIVDPTTVFIGPNNVGKTAILDAIRLALTRRWGQRGTGFTERDVYLPPGITDPKLAPPITIDVIFQEHKPGDWPNAVQTALDDIVQLDPSSGCSTILLHVTCPMDPTTGAPEPHWEFLNIEGKKLTGQASRSVNLQEFFPYVPVFYLGPLRDAGDEFSSRSQFWGRLIKAMNIPETLQQKLQQDLDQLNQSLLAADPRMATITNNLKTLTTISPTDAPGDLQLRSLPLKPWDLIAKTEVVYKADPDRPWLPLGNHGQGIQSLAVIYLFDAFVKHLLAEIYRAESTPILELEEPETHLHPQATKSLCASIMGLNGQKLMTTHSPYFVQSVPFRNLRIVRLTDQGTSIAWLPPAYQASIPHIPALDGIIMSHDKLLSYSKTTSTLTAKGKIDDDLYKSFLKAYAKHPDVNRIIATIKDLKKRSGHHIPDDELAKLETWARRIRGEIFFARKWLIVEGQSDYLLLHTVAKLHGYCFDEHGVSIIDAQNSGNPGTFAALARALTIPWAALFDGDQAGNDYLTQIANRDFGQVEITNRCTLLPAGDLEEELGASGLQAQLRIILRRLGHQDAPTMTVQELVEKLRSKKTEYSIELCEDLRKDPSLMAHLPATITAKITQVRSMTV